ncbi:MAG TPA: hypothetical protein VFG86_13755 [Chloroflexota bacterium]|nr:hypothetical protein [Chloroflexota bacterium]
MRSQPQQLDAIRRDAPSGADHDQPYRFGWKPTADVPFPFNTRQLARLLVLRSRVQAGQIGADDVVA